MTKQNEWRDKYKAELAPKFTPKDIADEKMTQIMTDIYVNTQADFFYQLHLQEVSKIREKITKLKLPDIERQVPCPDGLPGCCVYHCEINPNPANKILDDVLLAITDEK